VFKSHLCGPKCVNCLCSRWVNKDEGKSSELGCSRLLGEIFYQSDNVLCGHDIQPANVIHPMIVTVLGVGLLVVMIRLEL